MSALVATGANAVFPFGDYLSITSAPLPPALPLARPEAGRFAAPFYVSATDGAGSIFVTGYGAP